MNTKETYISDWHRELGSSEYRVTFTMDGYGSDEDAADAFLDSFHREHPEMGPVVTQSSDANTISITLGVSATSVTRAFELTHVAWLNAGGRSGLRQGKNVTVNVEALTDSPYAEPAFA